MFSRSITPAGLTAETFSKKLEQFSCQKCNECCRKPGNVYLAREETVRIAEALNLDIYRFMDEYCSLQDRSRIILKQKNDESCVFLGNEGCKIHSVKPQQCLDFPVRWRTQKSLDYCAGIRMVLGEAPEDLPS